MEKDKVAIIVWTKDPSLFVITDKYVAEAYLKFFDGMWKKAKS